MDGRRGELRGVPYFERADGKVEGTLPDGRWTYPDWRSFESAVLELPAPPVYGAARRRGISRNGCALFLFSPVLVLAWMAWGSRPSPGFADADIADTSTSVRMYASTVVISVTATQRCPGFHLDNAGFDILRATAGVRDDEKAALDAEVERYHGVIESAIAKIGAPAWCMAVWENYGPRGVRTISR